MAHGVHDDDHFIFSSSTTMGILILRLEITLEAKGQALREGWEHWDVNILPGNRAGHQAWGTLTKERDLRP